MFVVLPFCDARLAMAVAWHDSIQQVDLLSVGLCVYDNNQIMFQQHLNVACVSSMFTVNMISDYRPVEYT